jgi:hypothetical protein
MGNIAVIFALAPVGEDIKQKAQLAAILQCPACTSGPPQPSVTAMCALPGCDLILL